MELLPQNTTAQPTMSIEQTTMSIAQTTMSIEQRVATLEKEIGGLQTQNHQLVNYGRAVMFFAQLTHTLSSVAVEQGVVFDHTVTNVGDCYSGNTGVFTCCRAGNYMFFWSIDVNGGNKISTELMRNTSSIAINHAGDANNQSTGNMMALLHLTVGDEVWIRVTYRHPAGTAILGNKVSSFTGFLVQ